MFYAFACYCLSCVTEKEFGTIAGLTVENIGLLPVINIVYSNTCKECYNKIDKRKSFSFVFFLKLL